MRADLSYAEATEFGIGKLLRRLTEVYAGPLAHSVAATMVDAPAAGEAAPLGTKEAALALDTFLAKLSR